MAFRDRASPFLLAGLLAAAGTTHFVRPQMYRPMIPRSLPAPRAVVFWSGLAEWACAGLVMVPRTRRVGGYAAAALFVAVFPANVKVALDGGIEGAGFPLDSPVVAWARLPLQVPLVLWAVAVARQQERSRVV